MVVVEGLDDDFLDVRVPSEEACESAAWRLVARPSPRPRRTLNGLELATETAPDDDLAMEAVSEGELAIEAASDDERARFFFRNS